MQKTSNAYRNLQKKYETLTEIQRSVIRSDKRLNLAEDSPFSRAYGKQFSLSTVTEKDAVASIERKSIPSITGNINSNIHDSCTTVHDSSCIDTNDGNVAQTNKNCDCSTTVFSEAETSSSEYSDDICNKSTQTDQKPGYFLCSIDDGKDCKFHIYDDVSPIDSRFRNRPEYRELFKKIFSVLKKAADNKTGSKQLPLLDNIHRTESETTGDIIENKAINAPSVTSVNEELLTNYTNIAHLVESTTVSEKLYNIPEHVAKVESHLVKKGITKENQGSKSINNVSAKPKDGEHAEKTQHVLKPLKRKTLDYISAVNISTKKSNRNWIRKHIESQFAFSLSRRIVIKNKCCEKSPNLTKSCLKCNKYNDNSSASNKSFLTSDKQYKSLYKENANCVKKIISRPVAVLEAISKLKGLDLTYAEVLRYNYGK